VGRQLIDTLLVVILAAFFQGGIANVVDGVVRRWPRHERKAVRDLLWDVERRGGGYVRRSVLLGIAAAVAVAAACWAWGVPGGVLLGCWVGAWSAVPWFGWLIGAAPLVVTAFADGRREGIAITVVATALVALTSLARRRLVERHELRLGPALTVLAFAAGIAAAGFGGLLVCLVGVALAGAVLTSPHTVVRPYSTEPPPGEPVDDERRADVPRGARALLRPSADGGAVLIAPGWRGAATVVGGALAGVLVWMVAGRVGVVTVWVVVGGLVAIALSRPVGWVQRRLRVPRVAAVALVFTVALGVVAAAVAAGVAGGATTSSRLSEELPTIVEDLETAPLIGSWLRDRDAATWVSDQMNDLPQRLEEARDVSEWLPTVGARVLDLFWTVLIALALLLDGPRLVAAVERRVPARRRRQFSRLVDVSQRAIGGYLAGAAIVAGLNATVVFVIAISLGVALAPVLAVWAFIWNFVPQIGGFMGGFPLVVLALAVGPVQAILAGALFVTYQFIENHLIQPAVISEAIDVPPWVTLLAALAGGAAAGVVGAVVLTPLVGVVRVVLLEVRRRDFPGNTVPIDPLVEPAPDPVGV
jgi:predicted PurR-regulated permease PerM